MKITNMPKTTNKDAIEDYYNEYKATCTENPKYRKYIDEFTEMSKSLTKEQKQEKTKELEIMEKDITLAMSHLITEIYPLENNFPDKILKKLIFTKSLLYDEKRIIAGTLDA